MGSFGCNISGVYPILHVLLTYHIPKVSYVLTLPSPNAMTVRACSDLGRSEVLPIYRNRPIDYVLLSCSK
jgi:hypothetical protein